MCYCLVWSVDMADVRTFSLAFVYVAANKALWRYERTWAADAPQGACCANGGRLLSFRRYLRSQKKCFIWLFVS